MATKKVGTSLESINAQIAKLQAQAAVIRNQEVGAVVAKIKDAIAHYGLTAADLGLVQAEPRAAKDSRESRPGRTPGGKAAKAARKTKTTRAAKYSDEHGHTWSGLGKRPDWFKAALAAGKTPEQLLVKA